MSFGMDLGDAKEAYKKLDEMMRQDQEQRDKKCSHSAPTKKNWRPQPP
jgi:hypothetical protein